jgi:hypothetical protein
MASFTYVIGSLAITASILSLGLGLVIGRPMGSAEPSSMAPLMVVLGSTAAIAFIVSLRFIFISFYCSGTKRQMPMDSRVPCKFLTFRISNIPRYITPNQLRDILTSPLVAAECISGQLDLLGLSHSPAALSSLAERYWVATATFHAAPDMTKLETAIKRQMGARASRLTVDLDFFGLTPLADPLQNTAVE